MFTMLKTCLCFQKENENGDEWDIYTEFLDKLESLKAVSRLASETSYVQNFYSLRRYLALPEP